MRFPVGVGLYLIFALLNDGAESFYIPGVAPVEFKKGDDVPVKAVKMTSSHTQLPYQYYNLPFCQPEKLKYKSQNLGEVLRGDRISNTPYKVQMREDAACKVLCSGNNGKLKWNAKDSEKVSKRIRNDYFVHFLVDNLPVATKFHSLDNDETLYEHGFRLGYVKEDKAFINNHLKFVLKFHEVEEEVYRVVGFEAEARSIDSTKITAKEDGLCQLPSADSAQEVPDKGDTEVMFTYEVVWERSPIEWASRWDTYLAMKDVNIHWFSIINSVVVVVFLSGILTMIIIRTLRRDITQYNQEDDLEDQLEETGWKLVHGDVFRPPKNNRLFAAVIGSGVQLLCMAFIVITFAMFGMLSPASRGTLMTAAICLYLFMGLVAGYFSARLYKTMKGVQWKKAALLTATLYPSLILGIGFLLNFFTWGKHSSQAVPFTTMLVLLTLWFGVSVPLVYLGYYFGFRKQPYQHPVRTNQIPRQVPEQQWYANHFVSLLMAGVLPFGAMFIELFFIFSAIWENQFYYLFGFLFLVFLILIVSCSQISIVMVYFQLCAENYHWWWRSFITSGGCAVYVFAYSVFYFITNLEIDDFIPTLLYFTYTLLMVLTFWLLTGTIGFYAAYFFIRRIYAAIKIE